MDLIDYIASSAIAMICVAVMFICHMMGLWDPVQGFKKKPKEEENEDGSDSFEEL